MALKFANARQKKRKSYKVPHNSPHDINAVTDTAEEIESQDYSLEQLKEARAAYDEARKTDPTCSSAACKAARSAWQAARP